jgi:hypothetical protein
MDKDNPNYRIFGSESNRLLDAYWQIKVLRRLKKYKLITCAKARKTKTMNKNNLKLWNSVEKTNPKYTKKAKIGGMSITAIAPQYQIMMVTEQFGVYGQTWGFKNIELDYSLVKYDMVVFKGTFFFPEGEFEIINSCKLYINNAKTMLDDNFAKKIETDTLTKAISKLGFNADIFMGKFDDVRYLAEITKEFAPKPIKQPLSDERFTKALIALKDGKITKESLNAYALTSEQVKTLAK